jgi:hypothetical protein
MDETNLKGWMKVAWEPILSYMSKFFILVHGWMRFIFFI